MGVTHNCKAFDIHIDGVNSNSINYSIASSYDNGRILERVSDGRLEWYVSHQMDSLDDTPDDFKSFFVTPLDDQTVDAHIDSFFSSISKIKSIKVSELQDSAYYVGGKKGAKVPEDGVGCFLNNEDSEKDISKITLNVPRKSNNIWNYTVNSTRDSLEAEGVAPEKIDGLVKQINQKFETGVMKSEIKFLFGNSSLHCRKKISAGLISFDEVKQALGEHIEFD